MRYEMKEKEQNSHTCVTDGKRKKKKGHTNYGQKGHTDKVKLVERRTKKILESVCACVFTVYSAPQGTLAD